MRLSRVELHEFVKIGDAELHSRVVDAKDGLVIEADHTGRVVWFRLEGKPARFTPFENVRYGDEAPDALLMPNKTPPYPCITYKREFETPRARDGHAAHCGKPKKSKPEVA